MPAMPRSLALCLLLATFACKSSEPAATPAPQNPPQAAADGKSSCTSTSDCKKAERCTTDDGVCDPPPGCSPEFPCLQVCTGSCVEKPTAAKVAAKCTADADCKAVASYCHGCACLALGASDEAPACDEPPVNCLVAPCQGRKAICKEGVCAVIGSAGAPAK
ncbi:MAG: hypothetical protein U1E65_10670 [Myxococcota bacterium]